MAKAVEGKNVRVIGIKPSTVGALQGTLFALVGLVTAIGYSMSKSIDFAETTDSVLRGLTFGLAHGFVSILVVPVIYFAVGWLIGFLQGFVLNALVHLSGGLVVKTEEDK